MKTRTARIGPKMRQAADYVSRHPGCSKLDVARDLTNDPRANPHGHGQYDTIDKAIAAGLIVAERIGNRYSLTSPST
jgi:hypothetical protein